MLLWHGSVPPLFARRFNINTRIEDSKYPTDLCIARKRFQKGEDKNLGAMAHLSDDTGIQLHGRESGVQKSWISRQLPAASWGSTVVDMVGLDSDSEGARNSAIV